MRKGRYDDKCIRAVWRTVDGEKYDERVILGSVKQLILFDNQNVGLAW